MAKSRINLILAVVTIVILTAVGLTIGVLTVGVSSGAVYHCQSLQCEAEYILANCTIVFPKVLIKNPSPILNT